MSPATDRDDIPGPAESAEGVEVPRPHSDPYPSGPNEDMGNLAAPPADVDEPRTSDDNDLNAEGGGFTDTPLRRPYAMMARRDELARQMEDLLVNAQEWADEEGSPEALDIYESLNDIYGRLGEPSEDTDD